VEKFRKATRHYSRRQVERVFSLLREYDLKSKGVDSVGTPDGELLKELVVKILAC
jgi:DNA polymerase-3 subunit delta